MSMTTAGGPVPIEWLVFTHFEAFGYGQALCSNVAHALTGGLPLLGNVLTLWSGECLCVCVCVSVVP